MRWNTNPPSPNLLEKLCFSRKPPHWVVWVPMRPRIPRVLYHTEVSSPFRSPLLETCLCTGSIFSKRKPSPSLTWSLFWLKNHVRKEKTIKLMFFSTPYTFPSLLLKLNELSSKPVLKAWRLFQWLNVSRKSSPVVWVKFPKKPWEAGRTLPTFTT